MYHPALGGSQAQARSIAAMSRIIFLTASEYRRYACYRDIWQTVHEAVMLL